MIVFRDISRIQGKKLFKWVKIAIGINNDFTREKGDPWVALSKVRRKLFVVEYTKQVQ